MTIQYALKNDDHYGVRFLHFRATETNGLSKKKTNDNKVDTSYGGVTIAYDPMLVIRKDGTIGVFVEIGATLVSGHDRYVKAIGREKSINFLVNHDPLGFHTLYLGEGEVHISDRDGMVPLNSSTGELFIDERLYNLRGEIARRLELQA